MAASTVLLVALVLVAITVSPTHMYALADSCSCWLQPHYFYGTTKSFATGLMLRSWLTCATRLHVTQNNNYGSEDTSLDMK